jgi:hypothetical protein
MNGPDTMLCNRTIVMDYLFKVVAYIITMSKATWGAYVSSDKDLFIPNDHATGTTPVAGSPL